MILSMTLDTCPLFNRSLRSSVFKTTTTEFGDSFHLFFPYACNNEHTL